MKLRLRVSIQLFRDSTGSFLVHTRKTYTDLITSVHGVRAVCSRELTVIEKLERFDTVF